MVTSKKPRQPSNVFSKQQLAEFVVLWTKAESALEVAQSLELPLTVVCNLASRLRRKGVVLKKFTNRGKVNASSLNAAINRVA